MTDILYNYLFKYYSSNGMDIVLQKILDSNLSLRIVDWFVTNYSKKNDTYYYIKDKKINPTETGMYVNVFQSYKMQLKSYSKKRFDPFCRRERIDFKCGVLDIKTTIGQLNFFKWAIEYKICDYIDEYKEVIELDMNNSLDDEKKKKRQELSKSAIRGVNKKNINITLSFT